MTLVFTPEVYRERVQDEVERKTVVAGKAKMAVSG
jgi:hypothetical protein